VVVVNVSNIKRWDGFTPLAWDVWRVLSQVLSFEGEVVVCWEDSDHVFGYDHEYCLIFRNSALDARVTNEVQATNEEEA
jgi:hypothetical protein